MASVSVLASGSPMTSARTALLLMLSFSMPATGAYGQCVIFEKPEELFALSDAVFVGTVRAVEPTMVRGEHLDHNFATLRAEKVWKGQVSIEVRVDSDVPFEVGKKYVVSAGGKPLSTSIKCLAAQPVDRAKRKMEWLSRRRSRSAGSGDKGG
jgi:hypothetical protein